MILWPNQERALSELSTAILTGENRILVTGPTGCGKTRIMTEHIIASGAASILYTHRKMLMRQTHNRFVEEGIDCGILASGYVPKIDKPVQVAMIQSEAARQKRGKQHFPAVEVLVDEAHVQKAGQAESMFGAHLSDGAALIGFTATPINLGHMYDKLIVAGTNSEMRECGAHVLAYHFAPDEPDVKLVGKVKIGEGECGIPAPKRMKFAQRVFGRVIENYRKLNPLQKPSILFAPGVAESIWFAEQLNKEGISAAHIDGSKVWYNGELLDNSQEIRDEIAEASEAGHLKIVCNRFVLREGIDWPWIAHGIFATVFGSLSSYLQAGGRMIRAHESLDRVCVARGTMILTNRGEVPIEEVSTDDLIWDGVDFVSHGGAVCNGVAKAIEWQGITLTPDHKVLTDDGWKEAAEAKASCSRPVIGGIGGAIVRTFDDSNPYYPWERCEAGGGGRLQPLRQSRLEVLPQDFEENPTRMSALPSEVWRPLPGVVVETSSALSTAVPVPSKQHVSPIRRAWNRVPLQVHIRGSLLDCCESRSSYVEGTHDRPNRQQRTLRTWKPSVGGQVYTVKESRLGMEVSISTTTPTSRLRGRNTVEPEEIRNDERGNSRPVVLEVWDIKNCGPRNRYTANCIIVANCIQDHGGNFWRFGSLNENREWDLSQTDRIITQMRVEQIREEKEDQPIHCPQCNAMRLRGPVCHECGYQSTKRGRPVLQTNGTLKHQKIAEFKKRRKAEHTANIEKQWCSRVSSVQKSKKPTVQKMTFNQLVTSFARDNNWAFPPETLPMMPKDPIDWFLPVSEVPLDRLT